MFSGTVHCKTGSSQWSVFETVYRIGYRYNGQNCILVASTPESYAIILASLNGAKCPPFWCYGTLVTGFVTFMLLFIKLYITTNNSLQYSVLTKNQLHLFNSPSSMC